VIPPSFGNHVGARDVQSAMRRLRACALTAAVATVVLAGCGGGGTGDGGVSIEVAGFGRGPGTGSTYAYAGPAVDPPAATVWKYAVGSAVDRDRLDAIGDALDLPAAQITVSPNGSADWWAGTGAAGMAGCPPDKGFRAFPGVVTTVPAVEADAADPCAGTEPESALTAEQLLARGKELLTAMGLDVTALQITQPDRFTVVAAQLLGGLPSPLPTTIGFDANGEVAYASGHLADPVAVEGAEVADVDAALALLDDGWNEWSFGAFVDPGTGGIAVDLPIRIGRACEQGCDDSVVVDGDDPAAVDATLAEDGRRVEITDVTPSLLRVDSPDGTVWVVPSWTMTDGNEVQYVVPALSRAAFRVASACCGGDGGGVVRPLPAPVPLPAQPAPPVEPAVSDADAAALVGLGEAEATKVAESNGWTVRVVARDGESFAVTDDYRLDRVNLTIEDGAVSAATVG
jgi:hypothetical protein